MIDKGIKGAIIEGQLITIIKMCDQKIEENDRVENMTRIKKACQKAIDSGNDEIMLAFCKKMGIKT